MISQVKNKKNRRRRLLFAVLMGSFSLLYGATEKSAPVRLSNPVKRINNVQVNKAMRQVRQTVNDHQIVNNSLSIAIVCVGAAMFIHKYKSKGVAAAPAAIIPEVAPLNWGPYFASMIDPVGWGKWGLQLGVLLAGHHVIGGAVQYVIEKIEHDDSILWFKSKQTSYTQVMNDLIMYAEKIEKNDGAQEDQMVLKNLLIQAARDMVSQVEKIVGYMRYKAPLCEGKAEMAATLEKHMIDQTNNVVKELNACIAAGFRVSAVVGQGSALLKEYQELVDTCIDDFARLDPDACFQRDKHIASKDKRLLTRGRQIDCLPQEMQEKIELLIEKNAARLAQEERIKRVKYEEKMAARARARAAAQQSAAADRKQSKAGVHKKK